MWWRRGRLLNCSPRLSLSHTNIHTHHFLSVPVNPRRQSHYVVEEGQAVPELPCDAVCELEGRRHQLAGAFGVDNPDRHISYFERHRWARGVEGSL